MAGISSLIVIDCEDAIKVFLLFKMDRNMNIDFKTLFYSLTIKKDFHNEINHFEYQIIVTQYTNDRLSLRFPYNVVHCNVVEIQFLLFTKLIRLHSLTLIAG